MGLHAARGAHLLNPPLSPAAIPYAVDPHTVEQAWFLASRWSAPLYERPGRQGPRLLGSAWVDGVRDGSAWPTPQRTHGRQWRPLHPGAGRSPAGGTVLASAGPSHTYPGLVFAPCGRGRAPARGPGDEGKEGRRAGDRPAPPRCARYLRSVIGLFGVQEAGSNGERSEPLMM